MTSSLFDLVRTVLDPQRLLALLGAVLGSWLGYAALFAIVFSETGLLVGFVLPGDSLLFTVGTVAGGGKLNIVVVNLTLIAATVIGDSVGYWLGRKTGPRIFNRPNSRFFKREHLVRTHEFYEKYGPKTITFARFVPIVRTFTPFVAGVAEMKYLRFVSYDVLGGIGWVTLLTGAGYTLGTQPFVQRHFDKVILVIIFVSLLPTVIEVWKARRRRAQ
jgi:membrane-associated protein